MKYKSVNVEPAVYERLVIVKSMIQTRLKRIITFTDTISFLIDIYHKFIEEEEKKEMEESKSEPKSD